MNHVARTTLVLIMILVNGIACTPKAREEPVIQDTGSRPLTAKQAFVIAKSRAQNWQAQAYLAQVIMVIPGNDVESGPRKIVYYFIADHALGPLRWWDSAFITIDAYESKIVGFDESRWATHPQGPGRFDIESTTLDSSDALRMAEDLGGKVYREKFSNAQVRIIGTSGIIRGELFWEIGYFRPPDVRDDELSFGIEARTGEVRGDVYRSSSLSPK